MNTNFNDDRILIQEINNNPNIINNLSEDLYYDNDFKNLLSLDCLDGEEYNKVYNEIISVEEYKINQIN